MADLVSGDSQFAMQCPEAALSLMVTIPSALPAVVALRLQISALIGPVTAPMLRAGPATVVHRQAMLEAMPTGVIYTGCGILDSQGRPSPFLNPFSALLDSTAAFSAFVEYIDNRADLSVFLRPLAGVQCICDCSWANHECHSFYLIKKVNELAKVDMTPTPPVTRSVVLAEAGLEPAPKRFREVYLAPDPAVPNFSPEDELTATDDESAGADSDGDAEPPPDRPIVSPEDLRRVDESSRSTGAFVHRGPSWPQAWLALVLTMRAARVPVFWELFAGCAALTAACLAEGWVCGPPIDILDEPAYDLLDPMFIGIVVGLLLEGRCRWLHLGPPCSSFSMACNRCFRTMMRNKLHPCGLPDLKPVPAQKVKFGNAMADVSVHLAGAQLRVLNQWTWEQPKTSLMWDYPSVKEFMAAHQVVRPISHVCCYGAPWVKPTAVATSMPELIGLHCQCPGGHTHITLQGAAPCGTNWTAVASPYWPEYAAHWARLCAPYRPSTEEAVTMGTSHLSGFAAEDSTITIEDILKSKGYQPSRKRSVFITAMRVCAGQQPSGRALPALMPEGMGPETHLQVALKLIHPMARPVVVPLQCKIALAYQQRAGDKLEKQRFQVLALVEKLAAVLAPDSERISAFVHPWIRKVVCARHIALMRELNFVLLAPDPLILLDLVFGLPMAGWARHSPALEQKMADSPSPQATAAELAATNALVLSKVKPTGDHELDVEAWKKTSAEFDNGCMIGPFYNLEDIPGRRVQLLPRFPIREKHGGATAFKVRMVDDCKLGGQNAEAATSSAHRPADLDMWVLLLRILGGVYPEPLSAFTSDFKAAYRQVAACPHQAERFAIASWDTDKNCIVFGLAVSQMFGSSLSPLNFSRFPDWCATLMATLFGVIMAQCVDDLLAPERKRYVQSAYRCWRVVADLTGWDVPDEKSPPPSQSLRTLGATTDLRDFPRKAIMLRVAKDRVAELTQQILEIHKARYLRSALAGKLFGRLMFCSSQYFGRLGRSMIRAYNRRQHETAHNGWNRQLESACRFWLRNLPQGRPREVPMDFASKRFVVSYSDGEGSTAGVGVAIWSEGEETEAGYLKTPPAIRRLWSRQREIGGEHYDILEIEALGPALVLATWPDRLRDALWVHFIDNENALMALVRGGSSVHSADLLASWVAERTAEVGAWAWFDRVDTKSNPVDGLSRGDMSGPWKLVPIKFPTSLRDSLLAYLEEPLPFVKVTSRPRL